MKVINITKDTLIAENLFIAETLLKRTVGLLGRKEFKKGEALLIKPCQQIHTFFMRFSIDLLFLDKRNWIVKTIKNFPPWRISGIYPKAKSCLELPSGIIESTFTQEGDEIFFSS